MTDPTPAPFEVDDFLARPLVARVATAGPTVRPVWYLWEDSAFWWMTGPWSTMAAHLEADPQVALVVDSCDLSTGKVLQVRALGEAEVVHLDPERARRKLRRYLGPRESSWDPRFWFEPDSDTRMVRLSPQRLEAYDLSFRPAG